MAERVSVSEALLGTITLVGFAAVVDPVDPNGIRCVEVEKSRHLPIRKRYSPSRSVSFFASP